MKLSLLEEPISSNENICEANGNNSQSKSKKVSAILTPEQQRELILLVR